MPPATLPPEPLGTAMTAGLRYVAMSPHIEKVLLRAFVFGFTAIIVLALLPLVSRDLPGGGPLLYGLLLGCYGIGAVGGAFVGTRAREKWANECVARAAFIGFAVCAVAGRARPQRLGGWRRHGDWRGVLGAGARHVQRHGAAFDAALGTRAGAGALSDLCLRRHGAGQLDLGPGRREVWHRCRPAGRRGADARRCRDRAQAGAARQAAGQSRPPQSLAGAASRARPAWPQRSGRRADRVHHPRGGHSQPSWKP